MPLVEGVCLPVLGALLRAKAAVGGAPSHVALILDGNRRWARKHKLPIPEGHDAGARQVVKTLRWCYEMRISTVSLYVFSEDNLNRSQKEVSALFTNIIDAYIFLITDDRSWMRQKGVRFCLMGDLALVPRKRTRHQLAQLLCKSRENHRAYFSAHPDAFRFTVNIGFMYSGIREIADASNRILHSGLDPSLITPDLLTACTYTGLSAHSCPDLLIRTSGETRLSDFMPLQMSMGGGLIHFSKVLWPDFSMRHFLKSISEWQRFNYDRKRKLSKLKGIRGSAENSNTAGLRGYTWEKEGGNVNGTKAFINDQVITLQAQDKNSPAVDYNGIDAQQGTGADNLNKNGAQNKANTKKDEKIDDINGNSINAERSGGSLIDHIRSDVLFDDAPASVIVDHVAKLRKVVRKLELSKGSLSSSVPNKKDNKEKEKDGNKKGKNKDKDNKLQPITDSNIPITPLMHEAVSGGANVANTYKNHYDSAPGPNDSTRAVVGVLFDHDQNASTGPTLTPAISTSLAHENSSTPNISSRTSDIPSVIGQNTMDDICTPCASSGSSSPASHMIQATKNPFQHNSPSGLETLRRQVCIAIGDLRARVGLLEGSMQQESISTRWEDSALINGIKDELDKLSKRVEGKGMGSSQSTYTGFSVKAFLDGIDMDSDTREGKTHTCLYFDDSSMSGEVLAQGGDGLMTSSFRSPKDIPLDPDGKNNGNGLETTTKENKNGESSANTPDSEDGDELNSSNGPCVSSCIVDISSDNRQYTPFVQARAMSKDFARDTFVRKVAEDRWKTIIRIAEGRI